MNPSKTMKLSSIAAALLLSIAGPATAESTTYEQFLADHNIANRAEKSEAGQRRLDWWRDARFGMFIHWNPSSVAACEISWSKQFYPDIGENLKPNPRPDPGLMGKKEWKEPWLNWFQPPVPREVYDNLPKSFFPAMFDADKIVAQAKAAGMRYIVQVAKKPGEYGVSTRKNQVVCLHVLKWPESGTLDLPAIPANLKAAKLLSGGKVAAKQENGRILVSVDAADRTPVDTVVALEFDQSVTGVAPIQP